MVGRLRECKTCEKYKAESEFYFDRRKNRIDWLCKPCKKKYVANWKANNPQKLLGYRHTEICKRYGLKPEDFDRMMKEQGGACAICLKKPVAQRLGIDHCHTSGKVRGLLCTSCNGWLGRIDDNKESAYRAIAYLEKHEVRGREACGDRTA